MSSWPALLLVCKPREQNIGIKVRHQQLAAVVTQHSNHHPRDCRGLSDFSPYSVVFTLPNPKALQSPQHTSTRQPGDPQLPLFTHSSLFPLLPDLGRPESG